MDKAIQVFSNQDFSVRTTRDEDGTVWFVGKDVLTALEYSETSTPAQVLQSVPEIWKGIKRIDTVERGEQNMLCLTEQGVYFFLGRSDKPKALPYQMWIAGDVGKKRSSGVPVRQLKWTSAIIPVFQRLLEATA